MSAAKDRAIWVASRSPDLVVWESPDQLVYQELRDYKPSPGPGWVKIWPPNKEKMMRPQNDDVMVVPADTPEPGTTDLYARVTKLTKQTTEVVELVNNLAQRVIALELKP